MGCWNFKEETNKTLAMWNNPEKHKSAKIIKMLGLGDDLHAFQKHFFRATKKIFMEGSDLNSKDMRMMQDYIKEYAGWQEKVPLTLSDSFYRKFYIGSEKKSKNHYVDLHMDDMTRGDNYRIQHSQYLNSHFANLLRNMREAVIEYDGVKVSGPLDLVGHFNKKKGRITAFFKITKLENELLEKWRSDKKTGLSSANDHMKILNKFLDNEGEVFKDLVTMIEADGLSSKDRDQILLSKYKHSVNKGYYNQSLRNAAGSWREIQIESKKLYLDAIDRIIAPENLNNPYHSGLLALRYGNSKTAKFLREEYGKIADQLKQHKGGYMPHFVFELMGDMMHMKEELMIASEKNPYPADINYSNREQENILNKYLLKAKVVSSGVSDRLKSKGKNDREYFSKNPLLFAEKYISDVLRFNHSTYVDRSYMAALSKLTSIQAMNPGTKEAEAMGVYSEILSELHEANKGIYAQNMSKDAKNLDRAVNSIYYTSKLGFSTRSPIKNYTQRIQNGTMFSWSGWAKATRDYSKDESFRDLVDEQMREYGMQFADMSKGTEGALDAEVYTDNVQREGGMFSTNKSPGDYISQGLHTAAGYSSNTTFLDPLLYVASLGTLDPVNIGKKFSMSAIETGNRQSTFKTAMWWKLEQLKRTERYAGITYADRIRPGESSEGASENAIKLREMTKLAGQYASDMTGFIHFDYSPQGKATAISGTLAKRLSFKFAHYPMSYAAYTKNLYKDWARARRATDSFALTEPEFQRMMSYALITGMGELASVIGAVNFTRYMSNELLEKLKDILIAFGMIEPEIMADGTERKPFYGGGAPGALHFLPMADMIKVINAGVAAQYWKHFVDPDTYMGQTLGFQNMDPMTNEDFGMEMLGLASVEGGRLVRSTIPAYRKSGIMSAAIAELGLYGGRTNILDIDTKDYTFDKLMGIEKSKLSSRQRGKALGSLDYLST